MHVRLINSIKRHVFLHLRIKQSCHPLLIYTSLSLVQIKKRSAQNSKTNPQVHTAACATSNEAANSLRVPESLIFAKCKRQN